MTLGKKAVIINNILSIKYPKPVSALNWETPWQMLVAAILSAQTTDLMVNKVTNDLFLLYPNVSSLNKASLEDIENIIRRVNYYRNKSKYIKYNAKIITENFNGLVPSSLDDLILLKGIGRKVANVIIGDVFGTPVGIVVDTHVKRVSFRLGLTINTNPVKIENDLVKLLPQKEWINISHRLIYHGREICLARSPKCEICPLRNYCSYYKNLIVIPKKVKKKISHPI